MLRLEYCSKHLLMKIGEGLLRLWIFGLGNEASEECVQVHARFLRNVACQHALVYPRFMADGLRCSKSLRANLRWPKRIASLKALCGGYPRDFRRNMRPSSFASAAKAKRLFFTRSSLAFAMYSSNFSFDNMVYLV